ncbi:hypothetical protein [Wenzhouxiangella sp. EGI_FJ10409]|uniref:hypothetical protein n=1 Tax=Wenzhouxiangella sp. EGI_FJ10409 TaxID=3243767 RepID=UPI0035DF6C37
MRVEADTEAQGPACRLVAEALGVEIAISGITAGEMRYRLEGQGEPWRWADLVGRGPIGVRLATDPIHEPVEGEPIVFETDLSDGRVKLVSGGEAEFRVEPHHADSGGILPYCFHAAVAQQLARAGVMSVHAAGIVSPRGGLLVVGRKGAGKSTLTASAFCAGFGVVSDDWLLAAVNGTAIHVERMRNYMMLRMGWASEQFQKRLPDGLLQESATRPRFYLRLPPSNARFPQDARINMIAVVERPRGGRRAQTEIEALPSALALAHLTESSMPVLLSQQLPVERACLFEQLSRALSQAPARRIRTGTDLVSTPEKAWRCVLQPLAGAAGRRRVAVDRGRSGC